MIGMCERFAQDVYHLVFRGCGGNLAACPVEQGGFFVVDLGRHYKEDIAETGGKLVGEGLESGNSFRIKCIGSIHLDIQYANHLTADGNGYGNLGTGFRHDQVSLFQGFGR